MSLAELDNSLDTFLPSREQVRRPRLRQRDEASGHQLFTRPDPWWKRAIDLAGATAALAMFSPLMVLIAVAVKLSSDGPVLFTQVRGGKGGRPFRLYKFRSMTVDAECRKASLMKYNERSGVAFKMANDPRITRVGAFLRRTSLDELPQLINVLKGDMSLVGPRPLPVNEEEAYDAWHWRRLDVKPGLTCIWQVTSRHDRDFDRWVRLDIEYIRNQSLWLDLKLIAQTVPAVLMQRGAC